MWVKIGIAFSTLWRETLPIIDSNNVLTPLDAILYLYYNQIITLLIDIKTYYFKKKEKDTIDQQVIEQDRQERIFD